MTHRDIPFLGHRLKALSVRVMTDSHDRMSRPTKLLTAAVLACMALIAIALSAPNASAATAQNIQPQQTATARQLLAFLPVLAERDSQTYDRTAFRHWIDADRDCQDTRAEVLARDSKVPVTYTSTRRCTVSTGSWFSWYDGATLTSASSIDIDHLIALKEAWESGASTWSASERERYANDLGYPASLQAIRDSVNQSKSDKDPANWMPSRAAARCDYVTKWVQVKYRWRLSVDAVEKLALSSVLVGCPSVSLTTPPRAR